MSRITPLQPPFDPVVDKLLTTMTPPGVPPIGLFRTFAHNRPMVEAMQSWGRYELSRDLSLTMREREIVIDRTCARCACEYEWGVHVAFFAERVGFDADQIRSLTHGSPGDPCWDERERTLITAVDELHDTNDLGDNAWHALAGHFDHAEILDALLLCGWYHAVCFAANGARVPPEAGAPRFSDVEKSV